MPNDPAESMAEHKARESGETGLRNQATERPDWNGVDANAVEATVSSSALANLFAHHPHLSVVAARRAVDALLHLTADPELVALLARETLCCTQPRDVTGRRTTGAGTQGVSMSGRGREDGPGESCDRAVA